MHRTLVQATPALIGQKVLLQGWVNTKRDHGKITFIDLRDRSGLVQVVGDKDLRALKSEDVVEITGLIKNRPENLVNPRLATGTIEIAAISVSVLNPATELPIPIDTEGYDIEETIRNKYRYLDLRRPRMARNIRIRSQVAQFMRQWLAEKDFVEIETPILTKTTPEGARDFLVPSRLQPGKFYALPQSPQQYKQLLMVAGFERYFQLARCFRDEDPRKDRAYGEFTQLDIEMSFVTQEDILQLIEQLFTELVKTIFPEKHLSQSPWPRLPHHEAVAKYGTDKPDLRQDKQDPHELAFSWTIDFPLFTQQSAADFFHGSGSAKWAPSHHMFTAPHPEDIKFLDSDPGKVRGLQHDLVLNGFEVGGGSIRIHQSAIQTKIFDLIGFTTAQKHQFEHLLTAFQYGVPPHGGIAPGVDRFVYVALGEPSIREVMAFPASASGQTAVVDAPSPATPEQLQELGLKLAGGIDQSQPLFEQIKSKLNDLGIAYKMLEHPPVSTSAEAAAVRDTPLEAGAKALILIADDQPIMVVLSATTKLDSKTFKREYGIKKLRFATPEEVEKISSVKIGAVPPLGSLCDIPTYVDAALGKNQVIVFNAGRHDRSIAMKYADYLKAEQPTVGKFS